MSHVTKYPSGLRKIERLVICLLTATIMFGGSVEPVGETEGTIVNESVHVVDTQLPVTSTANQIEETEILEEVDTEQEEHEEIELEATEVVEETPEVKRPNKLYYINDGGWKAHLDTIYQDYLYEMCVKYDVVEYYEMFLAQMYHESGFKVDVISKTNDYGLMQINKCNHEYLRNKFGFTDFLDPYVSIESGVYFMSGYLHKYNDVEKALVCYNRGESAVRKGTYSTSYSKGVLEDMNLLVELE